MKYLVVGCLLLNMLVAGCGGNNKEKETQLPKEKGAEELLLEQLEDSDAIFRLEAINQLNSGPGGLSNKAAEAVRKLLDDPDEEVKQAAAEAIEKMESQNRPSPEEGPSGGPGPG